MNSVRNEHLLLRFGCFLAALAMLAVAEAIAPRRPLTVGRHGRWLSNLGLALINTVAIRIVLPMGAVGVALAAERHGWGLLPALGWPRWLTVPLAVVALDAIIYGQHVLFHRVPWLWRLHLVHHADLDFDVTTGLRFHPLEALLSMGLKAAAVLVLGAPALAVLVFEVLLNLTSMFTHGNVRLPGTVDRLLRCLLVTPDMHRVHHSADVPETNSNFGFNLSLWDHLFGTYRAEPGAGQEGMTIGLAELRDASQVDRLPGMLLLPLQRSPGPPPVLPPSPLGGEGLGVRGNRDRRGSGHANAKR
jgi:sterol desaturase/sphingolipid hydroxylase (fatty acid hydroxylase superfamily)